MNRTTTIGIVALCLALTLLAGVASGLGVFARGDGSKAPATSIRGERYEYATTGVYRYNAERIVAEGVGWDWVTLFVVVPAMLVTLPFVARGSARARLIAAGLLGYLFYQYLMYALMWAFGPLFVLFVPLYAGSLAGIVWIATTIPAEELRARFAAAFPRRGVVVFTFAMAALLTLMWSARIAAGLRGDLAAAGLFGTPTMVVQALDLGIIVPLSVFTGVAALRRMPIAYLLAGIFVVKGATLALAIAAMLVSAAMVQGRLEVVPFAIFVAATLAALWLAVLMYRPERSAQARAAKPATA